MQSKLKAYFPLIKSREEVMKEIDQKPELRSIFDHWKAAQQQEFLDFCTGVRGVKILYDFMFKEILNPETVPERISEFLSLLLGQSVTVLAVLPNDNTRIADETSLLILDMVVELGDNSIVNIEVQKIGYKFPGQRSACYSSDLLLRQYKRVRSERKNKFNYKDIKTVHTIVLFEKSPRDFHAYPEAYLHHFKQTSDTGLSIDLLQRYLFIPLDIFTKKLQNEGISNKLDAWLAFISNDDPDVIIQIIKAYPEFAVMYEHVYQFCQSIERVIEMFSKELLEMDRNTVQLMIDEMQEEINEKDQKLNEKDQKLIEKDRKLHEKDQILSKKNQILSAQDDKINEMGQKLTQTEIEYQKALRRIAELESQN